MLSNSFQWYVIAALAEVVAVQAQRSLWERNVKILPYSKNIYKRMHTFECWCIDLTCAAFYKLSVLIVYMMTNDREYYTCALQNSC